MKKTYLLVSALAIASTAFAGGAKDKKGNDYPFFPSLLNTNSGKPVKSAEFEPPEVCGECHTEIYKQWNGSMHSSAWKDPVFQALWKLGNKETGGLTEKLCAGCHTAVGVVSEEIANKDEADEYQVSKTAEFGVQCDVCHSVKKATYLEAEGYEPHNATVVLDPGGPKRGPYKNSDSPHHDTEYSELHTSAEFCGNCHHVFHPVNNFPIERTYDEWKHSVYAQNEIVCQDCHMATVEDAVEVANTLKKVKRPGKAAENGPEREHVYAHYFVGGNFTIPGLLKNEKHAKMAEQRLKSAAKLEVFPPQELKPGKLATVEVKVTNVGAGHNLPTSLTEVRQMWLDVEVTDADGNKLLSSGWLDKDHNIDPDAVIFNANAMDKDDHHTVKPWEIVRFESNNTIPPKGSATEKYSFVVPEKNKGPLKVKATLRYRSYPQAVANLLLGDGAPVLPIVDMAKAEAKMAVAN